MVTKTFVSIIIPTFDWLINHTVDYIPVLDQYFWTLL